MAITLTALAALAQAQEHPPTTARSDYLLNCGGCHGLDGVSNSRLVPDLKNQVGYFLNLPRGRAYLVRLPNVAFSRTTDEALSELLNYVVFTLGGNSAPRGARPYTASEISRLREKPLNEVSLVRMRQQMVRVLIDNYNATKSLRQYDAGTYGDPPRRTVEP